MAKEKTVSTQKTETQTAQIPIEWITPEGTIIPFATNMLVQIMENAFKISFFQLQPAVRFSDSDPMPEKMRADFVNGVIVNAEKLSVIIEALQGSLEKFNKIKSEAIAG